MGSFPSEEKDIESKAQMSQDAKSTAKQSDQTMVGDFGYRTTTNCGTRMKRIIELPIDGGGVKLQEKNFSSNGVKISDKPVSYTHLTLPTILLV